MRTPRRRSGWAVLLALTGLLLGAAFAVRLAKSKSKSKGKGASKPKREQKQPARPNPAPEPKTVPAAGRSAAERALLPMAIGGALVVALAVELAVVTRPSTATVPGPGPARRSESVLVTGARGALATRAVLSLGRIRDSRSLAVIAVHVRNTGDDWIDTRFVDLWLSDSVDYRFPVSQLLPSDALSVSRLDRGREVTRVVEVDMSHDGLRRLHLEVPMGDGTAIAEWDLE